MDWILDILGYLLIGGILLIGFIVCLWAIMIILSLSVAIPGAIIEDLRSFFSVRK